MNRVLIGYLIEKVSRRLEGHTSYAADYIIHETKPGRYPLYLTFEGGYTIPMPYWLVGGIDSEIVESCYYSGFGGHNFAKTHSNERKPSKWTVQTYAYNLQKMVQDGMVELLPQFENLANEEPLEWAKREVKTWEAVEALNTAVAV